MSTDRDETISELNRLGPRTIPTLYGRPVGSGQLSVLISAFVDPGSTFGVTAVTFSVFVRVAHVGLFPSRNEMASTLPSTCL